MDRSVTIRGLQFTSPSLGQEMDGAFDRLYDALFGGVSPNMEDFRQAAQSYFDGVSANPAGHDQYFVCFTPIWNIHLGNGTFGQAEGVWPLALDPVQTWERAHPGNHIHKGTAYYFWGMTALLQGNIDRGYILMHQSFEEDRRTSGHPNPNTPGFAFVSLDFDQPRQAFRTWVQEQAKFVEGFVSDYSTTFSRTFTIGDLRDRYLRNPPIIDAVFHLTHATARLWDIARLPEDAKRNPFVSQIQLNLLFDLLLVIDNAIAQKSKTSKFFDHARFLLQRAGRPLAQRDLENINAQFKSGFDATLSAALAGSLTANGTPLDRLQCDVVIAYGLRNRGAHEIEIVPTIVNSLEATQRSIFRTLIAAVDYLY